MLKPLQQSSKDMEERKDLIQERSSRDICKRYNAMNAMTMATTKEIVLN
jgi:uncharacterized protein Yka (UPF0111/DUF47 family)